MNALTYSVVMSEYDRPLHDFIGQRIYNKEDLKDIMQETRLKIWKYISSFKGESSIWTWLCRIAITTKINYYKIRATKDCFTELNEYWDGESTNIDSASPESILIGIESLNSVEAKARSLNKDIIWDEYIIGNKNLEELSNILDKSYITANTCVSKCKKKLEEFIEERQYG